MKYTEEELIEAYNEVYEEEKPFTALLAGLIGAFPAAAMFVFFAFMGGILIWFIFIPAFFIGIFARFAAKPVRFSALAPLGVIAFVLHILGCLFLGFPPPIYILAPISAGIAMFTGKRKLTYIQELAISRVKLGKLNTNKLNQPGTP